MTDRDYALRAAEITRQLRAAPPVAVDGPAVTDPTFDLRRKQANLCEATMLRVFELESQAAALIEIAKKLSAAVLANT